VRQALMGGFAASRILEAHGERMVNRSFNPGFRIALHQRIWAWPWKVHARWACPCPTRSAQRN
jgi:hypothetical protein